MSFGIVAAMGSFESGLWCPVIIASMTFVIGLFFVRETQDEDITTQGWRIALVRRTDRTSRSGVSPEGWRSLDSEPA